MGNPPPPDFRPVAPPVAPPRICQWEVRKALVVLDIALESGDTGFPPAYQVEAAKSVIARYKQEAEGAGQCHF